MDTKNCCDTCYGVHYTHKKEQWGDFPACPCHNKETTTHSGDWLARFREKYLKKDWYWNPEIIEEFIAREKEASFKEGLNAAVGYLDKEWFTHSRSETLSKRRSLDSARNLKNN